MFRLQGQAPRLRAAEINRWNKLADQQARGELLRPPVVNAANYDPSSRVVLCKNTSGAAMERFKCAGIDGLVFDPLELDGSTSVAFEITTAASDKAPAITIEPIEAGGYGRAVIDGLALALVAAGSGNWATPAANLEPASSGSIKLLGSPDASAVRLLPVVLNAGSGGGSAKIVQTPVGGIAARSGTTPGSATCTEFKMSGGSIVTNTDTLTVYNIWPFAIPASFYIVAVQEAINDDWIGIHPGVVDVQYNDPDLEQTYDGTTMLNVDTAVNCP